MKARGAIVAGLASLAALLVAAPANAATTFGATDLSSLTANTNCFDCSSVGIKRSDGSVDSGTPAGGVLTQLSIRYETVDPDPTIGHVRVLHPTGNPNEFRNDGEATFLVPPEATVGGAVHSFPLRLNIAAGDHIAVGMEANAYYMHSDPDASCANRALDDPFAVGTIASYSPGTCGKFELLYQAKVEPDADGDGYGDETQDGCPGNGAVTTTCPTRPAPRCKKHKRKHRDAAAAKKHNKCKKRKGRKK